MIPSLRATHYDAPYRGSVTGDHHLRHAYGHISIGGNARVQLGDINRSDGTPRAGEEDLEHETDQLHLYFIAARHVMHFVDFSTKLLGDTWDCNDKIGSQRMLRDTMHEVESGAQSRQFDLAKAYGSVEGLKRCLHKTVVLRYCLRRALKIARSLLKSIQDVVKLEGRTKFKNVRHVIECCRYVGYASAVQEALNELPIYVLLGLTAIVHTLPKTTIRELAISLNHLEAAILNHVQALRSSPQNAHNELWETRELNEENDTLVDTLQNIISSHSELLVSHASALLTEVAQVYESETTRNIIASLSFPEIHQRYVAISNAQERTFRWVFDKENAVDGTQGFGNWLQSPASLRQRLYWISGKPGAGKSTLMRFLEENDMTYNLAGSWANEKNLLFASCFFWNAGTVLQKSQEGLLQTLLHRLLSQSKVSVLDVVPVRWHMKHLTPNHVYRWSFLELEDAMLKLLSLATKKSKILILIDGLDEFEGSNEQRQSMCLLLKGFSAYRAVKICVSSRPWNVYKDAFWKYPHLKLEDLTRPDIRNYVVDNFNENEYFQQWSISQPKQAAELVEAITGRAQGVFLWVYMAVKSLSQGLTDGDDARDMWARLEDIPSDLEDYFRLIMSKVPQRYLGQASEIFSLALLGSHLVMVYHFAHDDLDHAIQACENSKDLLTEVLRLQQVEERRINARCMGLLEPVPSSQTLIPQSLRRIDFFHRTARDFIASPSVQATLMTWQASNFHASTTLFEALIALLSSCSNKSDWLGTIPCLAYLVDAFELTHKIPHHNASIDKSIFQAQGDLERLLEHACALSRNPSTFQGKLYPKLAAWLRDLDMDQPDLFALALGDGLYSYALTRLAPFNSATWTWKRARSPLDFAMRGLRKTGISNGFVAVLRRLFELITDMEELKQCAKQYVGARLPDFLHNVPQAQEDYRRMMLHAELFKFMAPYCHVYVTSAAKRTNGEWRKITSVEQIVVTRFPQETAINILLSLAAQTAVGASAGDPIVDFAFSDIDSVPEVRPAKTPLTVHDTTTFGDINNSIAAEIQASLGCSLSDTILLQESPQQSRWSRSFDNFSKGL